MNNLLIIDTETTGLDPKNGKLIEIAAIYYNVASRTILHQMSTLFSANSNEAFEINRISIDSLKEVNDINGRSAMALLEQMASTADAVVAHNAAFDRAWIERYPDSSLLLKKWICTKEDFKWPIRKGVALNLVHIAVDLGVPIISAHRALTDCQLIVRCFDKVEDLEERLEKALSSKCTYIARVNYANRQIAKDHGFSWNGALQAWTKKLMPEEITLLPFPTRKID